MNERYINTYAPLLNQYINDTKYIDSGYPYGPFLPFTFSGYEKAPLKIFYMGRDIQKWVDLNYLSLLSAGEYISYNREFLTIEQLFGPGCSPDKLWSFIFRLHLYIITKKLCDEKSALSDESLEYYKEIGYGNLHSIIQQPTLKTNGLWNKISSLQYGKLKRCSSQLDRLKYILDVFEPDFIFILSWENYMDIFNGLEYKCLPEWYEEDYRSVFTVDGYKTRIIWTSHPRRYSFLGKSSNEMIRYLGDTLKNLQLLYDK